jgi:phosphohistidine phosphatase SixA
MRWAFPIRGHNQMNIYLIRHAERDRQPSLQDQDQPLSRKGKEQAEALAGKLAVEGKPTLLLTSRHLHARQTAEILRQLACPEAPLIPLNVLTPRLIADAFNFVELIAETRREGQDLGAHEIVAIVLHHPRQTQLAMMVQGVDHTNWRSELEPQNAEAICVTAGKLEDFAGGKGMEFKRI